MTDKPDIAEMPPRATRADARQNRTCLLQAAARVFAEEGFDAPLERVALAAGVSRATLYRNFADREALGFALFEDNVQALEDRARQLAQESDQDEAVFDLLELLMAHFVNSSGLADALRSQTGPAARLAAFRQRVVTALTPALKRAQDAGLAQMHLSASDLDMIMNMFGAALAGDATDHRREHAQKALAIVCRGLRT
jgi:AcrR family transcriptional regulator